MPVRIGRLIKSVADNTSARYGSEIRLSIADRLRGQKDYVEESRSADGWLAGHS